MVPRMNELARLFQESGVPGFAVVAMALLALISALVGLRLAERRPEVARIWTALALIAVTVALFCGVGGRAWSLLHAGHALEHVDPAMREALRAEMHRRAQGSVTLSLWMSLPSLLLGLVGARSEWKTAEGRWPLTPVAALAACAALVGALAIHRLPQPSPTARRSDTETHSPAESP